MTTLATAHIKTLHDEKREADRLSISPRTLQLWRLRGGGPPFIKVGACVRYNPDQVDAWLNERTRNNTSDPGPAAA